jgi:hypothetical protein
VKHFCHTLEARHFTIFTDHKAITYAFQQKRDKCSPRQCNHLDFIAQFTTDVRQSLRRTLSPTLSLASNQSPRRHHTTHWPYRRRATTSFEHFWRQARPCSSRNTEFPAPQSPSQQSWSHSVVCGQAYRKIAAPGCGLASLASAQKSPATRLLQ